jgi:hypothetical protein
MVKHMRATQRRGGAWWSPFTTSAAVGAFAALTAPVLEKWLSARSQAATAEAQKDFVAKISAEEKRLITSRLEAAALHERKRERGELVAARAAAKNAVAFLTPSGLPTGLSPGAEQADQEAHQSLQTLKNRYPAVFSAHPQYYDHLHDQIMAAIMSPIDPTDPLYVQKALGAIEYQLALEQSRLQPTPTPQVTSVARPDILMPAQSLAAWQKSKIEPSLRIPNQDQAYQSGYNRGRRK